MQQVNKCYMTCNTISWLNQKCPHVFVFLIDLCFRLFFSISVNFSIFLASILFQLEYHFILFEVFLSYVQFFYLLSSLASCRRQWQGKEVKEQNWLAMSLSLWYDLLRLHQESRRKYSQCGKGNENWHWFRRGPPSNLCFHEFLPELWIQGL